MKKSASTSTLTINRFGISRGSPSFSGASQSSQPLDIADEDRFLFDQADQYKEDRDLDALDNNAEARPSGDGNDIDWGDDDDDNGSNNNDSSSAATKSLFTIQETPEKDAAASKTSRYNPSISADDIKAKLSFQDDTTTGFLSPFSSSPDDEGRGLAGSPPKRAAAVVAKRRLEEQTSPKKRHVVPPSEISLTSAKLPSKAQLLRSLNPSSPSSATTVSSSVRSPFFASSSEPPVVSKQEPSQPQPQASASKRLLEDDSDDDDGDDDAARSPTLGPTRPPKHSKEDNALPLPVTPPPLTTVSATPPRTSPRKQTPSSASSASQSKINLQAWQKKNPFSQQDGGDDETADNRGDVCADSIAISKLIAMDFDRASSEAAVRATSAAGLCSIQCAVEWITTKSNDENTSSLTASSASSASTSAKTTAVKGWNSAFAHNSSTKTVTIVLVLEY